MRKLSRNEWIGVTAGVSIVLLVFFFPQIWKQQTSLDTAGVGDTSFDSIQSGGLNGGATGGDTTNSSSMITTASGLQYVDTVVGTGAEATNGKMVSIHYVGTFTNGQKFDSSVDRGEPLSFELGTPNIIKGFNEGVLGMKVGGKRTITVPSTLGYGPNDYGPIPGGSTLIFELQLVDVK